MKKLILLVSFLSLLNIGIGYSQVPNCTNAIQFCLSAPYFFTNVTNQASYGAGGIYGCLGSTPNAKLFYLQATTAGTIVFTINQNNLSGVAIDVDYVCWGPFSSPTEACDSISATKIVSCSYSGAASETCTITNAIVGQYYYLLCTNFSNQPGTITFTQTGSGGGASQCTSSCAVSGITANT